MSDPVANQVVQRRNSSLDFGFQYRADLFHDGRSVTRRSLEATSAVLKLYKDSTNLFDVITVECGYALIVDCVLDTIISRRVGLLRKNTCSSYWYSRVL